MVSSVISADSASRVSATRSRRPPALPLCNGRHGPAWRPALLLAANSSVVLGSRTSAALSRGTGVACRVPGRRSCREPDIDPIERDDRPIGLAMNLAHVAKATTEAPTTAAATSLVTAFMSWPFLVEYMSRRCSALEEQGEHQREEEDALRAAWLLLGTGEHVCGAWSSRVVLAMGRAGVVRSWQPACSRCV
jgi:hypothetical protein